MKIRQVVLLILIIIILIIPTLIKKQNNPKVEGIAVTPAETIPSPTLDIIVITETPIPTPTKRPSPTPTITPTPIPVGAMEDWFNKYASKESIDREKLKRIAVCESGLNPNARFLDYGGLFQFSTSSWISTRTNMNLPTDPALRFNPEEAIKTAAFKVATEGIHAWPNCNK
ncbi:transglycosylase family protein [Candidatus Gottesmanbacteria bacterium]|nr:transglycosylase family protein [Candidatus Gottesmanbacteria bacterium]